MANKFQSVFDDCVEAEKQFDCMFGFEEDDKLIEAVLTINEDAAQQAMNLPDPEELHQTDEESKPKDLRAELGPDHDANKPTADSSDQEIIADDDDDILDLACPKFGVQDAVQKNDPDNMDITDEIDKADKTLLGESLMALLDEAETDLGDNEGLGEPGDLGDVDGMGQETDKDELEDNEDKNEIDQMADPVNSVKESLIDTLLAECDDPSQCVAGEYTEPEDCMGEPDVNNNAKSGAEGTDKDPVYEDAEDILDAAAGNCKNPEQTVDKEYNEPEDGMGEPDVNNDAKSGAEGTDKDPVYESFMDLLNEGLDDSGSSDTEDDGTGDVAGPSDYETSDSTNDGDPGESIEDSALIEALLREENENKEAEGEDIPTTTDNGSDPQTQAQDIKESSLIDELLREAEELPEKVEDELIDDAEDAGEMSDAEVDAIDDVYDDDIIDDLMGDD